ncbi:MAG: MOSC domain-containing protein [Nitrososphaerales archaeon]
MTFLGTVQRLRRYPVKSMMGEDLLSVMVEPHGFVGDRIYAFVLDRPPNPRFPWMTARQAAEMLLYKPRFHLGLVEVTCPDGTVFAITDVALEQGIEEKADYEISLLHQDNGCHDSKPISLLGLQTINKLAREISTGALAPERFRANIYVNWDSGEPFLEGTLLGKVLSIGDNGVELKIVKKDSRCIIPTLDPETTDPNPAVLETIKSNHGGCLGVYAEVRTPGILSSGDRISIA